MVVNTHLRDFMVFPSFIYFGYYIKNITKVSRRKQNQCNNKDIFYIPNLFNYFNPLKLVSTIFYQFFVFSRNDSPSKTVEKSFLFHLKSSFHSRDIQMFLIFSLPFHTLQIQKDKLKWNNLWCHELAIVMNCHSNNSKTALYYYIIKLGQIIYN